MKIANLYDIKNSSEVYARGSVIKYPDYDNCYWLCIWKGGPTKNRRKILIKCQICNIWSHKKMYDVKEP